MNPVSFKETQKQFTQDLEKADGPFEKVHVIDKYRQSIEKIPQKKKILFVKIKILANKNLSIAQKTYENALNDQPQALLLNASMYEYKELIEDLIRVTDADVNVPSKENNQTALHLSCQYNDQLTANLLIKYGANPNLRDHLGNTPLHYAGLHRSPELAIRLIKSGGANPFIKNNKGKPPLKCVSKEVLDIMHHNYNSKEPGIFSTSTKSPRYLPRDLRYIIYRLLDFKDVHNNLRKVNRASYNVVTGDILNVMKVQK